MTDQIHTLFDRLTHATNDFFVSSIPLTFIFSYLSLFQLPSLFPTLSLPHTFSPSLSLSLFMINRDPLIFLTST